MISYNRFYELFHEVFCYPNHLTSYGFIPSYSTKIENFVPFNFGNKFDLNFDINGQLFWWCEEPINYEDFENLHYYPLGTDVVPFDFSKGTDSMIPPISCMEADVHISIVANSEKSKMKNNLLKKYNYKDWYFFFHGFAALDWFRDFKYMQKSDIKITKLFICLNHILDKKRNYRLNLLNQLFHHNLDKVGNISAPKLTTNLIKDEIFDPYSLLSVQTKKDIYKNLYSKAQPIILDNKNSFKTVSADIIENTFALSSLWHIVPETIFYDEKLHLTEKIFKPIVIKRPFILIGAPGNLAYLKEYGFQTFDRWINEDYDNEPDPDLRIQKAIGELKKLQNKNLTEMYNEMLPVLEFNHAHFFGKFREIIVDEAIENFKKAMFMYNKDLSFRFRLPEVLDFDLIRRHLLF
jgi:hypothetical protein